MARWTFVVALLLSACTAEQSPIIQPSPTSTPSEIADAYAKEKSGGETLGCSTAAPGEESEKHPGCIYAVALSGCMEGLTGEPLGPPAEEEFQTSRRCVRFITRP